MEKKETFIVHILGQQNETWQGDVTWVGQNRTENFRSLLEFANSGSSDHAFR